MNFRCSMEKLHGTVRKFRLSFIISIRFRCAIAVRKQIGCRSRFVQAWVSFARTGKPEISGIEWPACADGDEAVMMLDKECRIRHNPDHELVNRLKKLQTAEHSVENVQH